MDDNSYKSIHSYTLDEEIALLAPDDRSLAVRADELFLSIEDDEYQECRLVMEVTPLVYEEIDRGQWLNLKTDFRNHEVSFNVDINIEIEAVLEEELLPDLAEYLERNDRSLDDIAEVGAYLVELNQTNPQHPLLDSENWYGTKVTQEIPIPSGIEGKIKQGYTTIWLDDNDDDDLDHDGINFQGPIYNSVIKFLRDRQINFFEFSDRNVIQIDSSDDDDENPWQFFVDCQEENNLCLCYATCPEAVPEEGRETMAIFLTRANYGLPFGCFELDFNDGEVRFRTSIAVEGDEPNSTEIERLLGSNWEVVSTYSSGILAVLEGKMSPEEAIADVE